jgi:hypothetical protein
MKPNLEAGRNVLLAGGPDHPFFYDFCLTVWAICRNQHGLAHVRNKKPATPTATNDANRNAEHEIIPGGGFWGGQPQAGGI